MRMALGAWHWFFLPQPYDLPERLLAADPEGFYFRSRRSLFAPEALAEYERCLRDPRVIHAICEDYRAGATIDYELDEADRGVRRIACPLLALWGEQGPLGSVRRRSASGARGPATCAAPRCPAGTTSRRRRPRRPTRRCTRSSRRDDRARQAAATTALIETRPRALATETRWWPSRTA